MIRVCMVGLGKTGREIARAVLQQEDMKLAAAICSPGGEKRGKDLGEIIGCGETGVIVDGADNIEQVIFQSKPDVAVDFSNPLAAVRNAKIFSRMKVNLVIGTTGFSKFALKRLYVLARKNRSGLVYAPNITLGVNVLMMLTNLASSILNSYDFQITEMHHRNKKDSPSGTALKIAREIEKGLTAAGLEQERVNVPIAAVRAGGIIGRHQVMIVGEDDKIEIVHESFSRKAFAMGAVRAARFISGKTGYFEMGDVLDLGRVLGNYLEKEGNPRHRRHRKFTMPEPPADSLAL